MIKSLLSTVSPFSPAPIPDVDSLYEINHNVNKIKILSSYCGVKGGKKRQDDLQALVSDDVMDGDMILLFAMSVDGFNSSPDGFKQVINAYNRKNRLGLQLFYKMWNYRDRLSFDITCKNTFVTMLTIRGASYIKDAMAIVDTANSSPDIITPRIKTQENGALISCFAYDEILPIHIKKQKTLASLKHGYHGLCVGTSETDGGMSQRIHGNNSTNRKTGGNDIALAVSIF